MYLYIYCIDLVRIHCYRMVHTCTGIYQLSVISGLRDDHIHSVSSLTAQTSINGNNNGNGIMALSAFCRKEGDVHAQQQLDVLKCCSSQSVNQ